MDVTCRCQSERAALDHAVLAAPGASTPAAELGLRRLIRCAESPPIELNNSHRIPALPTPPCPGIEIIEGMERGGNARAKAEDAIFDRVTKEGNVTPMVGEDSRVTGSGSATRFARVSVCLGRKRLMRAGFHPRRLSSGTV